jgi:hypothetical protein
VLVDRSYPAPFGLATASILTKGFKVSITRIISANGEPLVLGLPEEIAMFLCAHWVSTSVGGTRRLQFPASGGI